jgi:hypothetical protein
VAGLEIYRENKLMVRASVITTTMIRNLGICVLLGVVITPNVGIAWNRGALHGPINGPGAPIPAYYPTFAQPQRVYPPGTVPGKVAEEKTSTLYREIKPPEPLPVFTWDNRSIADGVLIKVGEDDCFVKVESGLIKVPLHALPEPAYSKYWKIPQAELEKRYAEEAAQRAKVEEAQRLESAAKAEEIAKQIAAAQIKEASEARQERQVKEDREARAELGKAVGITALVIFAVIFFFLPSIVAGTRHHRNREAICLLNLLLGWTFLGWVVALIWAVYRDKQAAN